MLECYSCIFVKQIRNRSKELRTDELHSWSSRTSEISRMPQDGALFLPEQPPILTLLNDILQQRFKT
jgi:hypothetical protein